ncbi:MAG: hypothetical protein MZV70_74135 [Desulfobacterales bacterium]|nr:hypothetical protein [Desulfobacterales bacterium]
MSRSSAKDYFEEMSEATADDLISEISETADLLDETSDAPIIKLVNLLVSGAIKDRASDIHVEPYSSSLKIRYRIDGILYDILEPAAPDSVTTYFPSKDYGQTQHRREASAARWPH